MVTLDLVCRHCERNEAIHASARGQMDCFAAPAMTERMLPVRVGPLELAQQAIAAFDGEVEGGLRRALAAENLLEFFVDDPADQHKGSKPDSLRVLGRRLQGQ